MKIEHVCCSNFRGRLHSIIVYTYTYQQLFIDHFADIAAPLHPRTRTNNKLSWTEACEQAFCVLKDTLTSPDFKQEFTVETGANDLGLPCNAYASNLVPRASRLPVKPWVRGCYARKKGNRLRVSSAHCCGKIIPQNACSQAEKMPVYKQNE